jgi:chromate transporter
MSGQTLLQLVLVFAPLSAVAVGGINIVLPDIHRQAVDVHGWITDAQFADLFALARAMPGPNMLIVALIGFQAAGWAGGLVATLAFTVPSALMAYGAASASERFHDAPWRRPLQAGLAPITIGLIFATGAVVTAASDTTPLAYVVTATTVALLLTTRVHPLLLMAGGAAMAVAGWL